MDTLQCLDVRKGGQSHLSCRQNVSLLPGNCSLACLRPSPCPSSSPFFLEESSLGSALSTHQGDTGSSGHLLLGGGSQFSKSFHPLSCCYSLCVHGRREGLGGVVGGGGLMGHLAVPFFNIWVGTIASKPLLSLQNQSRGSNSDVNTVSVLPPPTPSMLSCSISLHPKGIAMGAAEMHSCVRVLLMGRGWRWLCMIGHTVSKASNLTSFSCCCSVLPGVCLFL